MSLQQCGNSACPKRDSGPPAEGSSSVALSVCSRCRTTAYCSRECQTASWPTHKANCQRQNYIIKFHLAPEHITNPSVVRTISCPADANFYMVHMALQLAFGWATTHSFDFAVINPAYEEPDPNDMASIFARITQQSVSASSPREYDLRITDPAKQTMFSGIDRMHEGRRQHPNTVEKKADKYKLYQLMDDPKHSGKKLTYTYDFGDNWDHYFTLEGRAAPTRDFQIVSGTGHGVAEDAGGVHGWEELKEAYRAARPTAEQAEKRRWFEGQASNADPRGLSGDRVNYFDMEEVNRRMLSDHMFDHFEKLGDEAAQRSAMMEATMMQQARSNRR